MFYCFCVCYKKIKNIIQVNKKKTYQLHNKQNKTKYKPLLSNEITISYLFWIINITKRQNKIKTEF